MRIEKIVETTDLAELNHLLEAKDNYLYERVVKGEEIRFYVAICTKTPRDRAWEDAQGEYQN
jgi:hypothetical protein